MLDHLALARRRLVLGSLGVLVVAALVLAVVVGVAKRGHHDPRVEPVSQAAQPPVLIVPGYGGGTAGLDVLAAALRREGRHVTVVQLAGDGTGDLNVQADILEDAVRAQTREGAESVDMVGYSAGGVIARLWARQYDGGSVARRIVTLGAPQHGTALASLATALAPGVCAVACHQLATGSELIKQLNSGDETPPGPDWVSIWTTDDAVSTPPDTAFLTGALNFSLQQICPHATISHDQLPASPMVIAMVEAELRRTPPALPGPEVCRAGRTA